ncbi:hypothetical protein GZH46_02116, partial [Fragariocoptes setiger]
MHQNKMSKFNRLNDINKKYMIVMALTGAVCALLCVSVEPSQAVSLSEVWGESEGTQFKYRTDHDDLLSTKGSELQQRNQVTSGGSDEQQQQGEQAGAGGETEASSGQQAGGGAEDAAGQQQSSGAAQESGESSGSDSADASSKSEEDDSSASSGGGGGGGNEQGADSSPAKLTATAAGGVRGDARPNESDESSFYDAIPAAPIDEQSNVDAGNDDLVPTRTSSSSVTPSGSERRPVPLYPRASVQASRHEHEDHKQNVDHDNEDNDSNNNNNNDNSNNNNNVDSEFRENVRPMSFDNDDEPTYRDDSARVVGGGPAAGPHNQMIDFDQVMRNSQRSHSAHNSEAASSAAAPESNYEMVDVHRHEASAKRGFGTAGRLAPLGAGVPGHQSFHHPHAHSNYQSMQVGVKNQRLSMLNPDGERDHFQSPGHFPGSMPHLTQAASEQRTSKATTSSGQQKQQQQHNSATPTPSGSSVDATSKSLTSNEPVVMAESMAAAVSTVTQQAIADSDQQQIQAPTMVVTTTLAPSTNAPVTQDAPASSATQTMNNDSATASTKAPFKRFSFKRVP